MSQLKVNTIRHTGATSDAITLANDGTATARITNNLSNRNLIINGAMNIFQRGTSSTSTGYQTMDRMYFYWTGHDEALEQHESPLTNANDSGPWEKGFRKSFYMRNGNQTSGAGAGDLASFQYTVEAYDLATSGWNCTDPNSKLTLSFWVMSSVAQTFYGYLYINDGGGDSFSYSTGALSANTWKYVTVTIPGHADLAVDFDNGPGMTIYLQPFMGTDRTTSGHTLGAWQSWDSANRTPDNTSTWWTTNDASLEITGLQLEVGDTATDFEHRSYGDELLRCYRYYYRQGDGVDWGYTIVDNDNQWMDTVVHFPVDMRIAPTAVEGSGDSGDYRVRRDTTKTCTGGPNFNTAGTKAGVVRFGVSSHGWSTGDVARAYSGSSSAFIGWSAEL